MYYYFQSTGSWCRRMLPRINFESDEFHSTTAATVQDAQKLVEAGFEYVCDFNEVKLFKKRK